MTVISSVQWHGCIAQTATALRWSGGDGGGRVTFDVPDTEVDKLADLAALRGRELIITVIAADDARAALPFDDDDDPLVVDDGDVPL